MRKLFLSLACLFLMAGLTIGAEVVLVKFNADKKEVTVKEGDAEKTYKISEKTKFLATDGENTKELKYDDAVKGLSNPKAEGKMKFEITVKDGEITEAKMKGKKKKDKE